MRVKRNTYCSVANDKKDFLAKGSKGLLFRIIQGGELLGENRVLHGMCGGKSQRENMCSRVRKTWPFHKV